MNRQIRINPFLGLKEIIKKKDYFGPFGYIDGENEQLEIDNGKARK